MRQFYSCRNVPTSSHRAPLAPLSQRTRLAHSDPEQRSRFEANGDGRPSVAELLALRTKAHSSVFADARESQPADVVHTLSRPLDGSGFVISTVSPSALSRHNAVYLLLGTALLACGAAGIVLTAAL
jgi:hypothetical protein